MSAWTSAGEFWTSAVLQYRSGTNFKTRKPRDAAAVLFGLKFADNIHYTSLGVAKLRKPGFGAPNANVPAQNRI